MPYFIRVLAFLTAASMLGACDNGQKNAFQNPQNRAESDIRKSFAVVEEKPPVAQTQGSPVYADRAKLTIEKSALEKEFLLQSNLITQVLVPGFHGQKSRIVFFRQVENKIYMIEASQGLKLAKDYPTTLLLAEFPILAESEKSVTFDFNQGMSRLFLTGDWYARDFQGSMPKVNYRTAKAAFSYIERAAFANDRLLEVQQAAQIEVQTPDGLLANIPVKVSYYLTPYKPSETFVPFRAPRNYDRMGFFEVSPIINEQNGPVSYAAKLDISKPIVYAISANTPDDYKQAVRDGVLYWNKAFGKEIVQVVDAPKDVIAPHPLYNVVQWVDFDAAGFAYADANADPRTGEVLHQQVYFTSAFTLRRGIDQLIRKKNAAHTLIGLAGFETEPLCDFDYTRLLENAAAALRTETDPAKVKKAISDILREVVAHEIGHTLGLRHNFAGSLAGNYDLDQRQQMFKDYMETGSAHPETITSSSVMDYENALERMLHGDKIAKSPHAAEYDTKAIETLYLGKEYAASDLPLYCTDSHMGVYIDCNVFDAGSSYITWVKYKAHDDVKTLPNTLLEKFIYAKTPLFGAQPVALTEVVLSPDLTAVMTLLSSEDLLKVLKPDSRLLSVERAYPLVSSVNQEEVRRKTVELVHADLVKNGGYEGVLLSSSSEVLNGLEEKFDHLLADPEITRGIGANGQPYEFTAAEITQMKELGKIFFARYREELAKVELKLLSGKPLMEEMQPMPVPGAPPVKETKFDNTLLADDYANYLAKRVSEILTSTTGEPLVIKRSSSSDWSTPKSPGKDTGESKKTESTYTLPNFSYSFAVRKDAASLLRADRSDKPSWAYRQRIAAQKAFKSLVDGTLPGIMSSTPSAPGAPSSTYEEYPAEMISWILDATEIQKALSQ